MKSILSHGVAIAIFFASIFTMEIFPQSVRYSGDAELGFVASRKVADAQIDLSTTHGTYFSKPKLFVGAGAAVGWNINGFSWNRIYPVYGDIRKDFTINHLFTAFVDAKAGYSFQGGWTGDLCDCGIDYGFYCCPSVGIKLAVRDKFGVFLKIGYTYQEATKSFEIFAGEWYVGSERMNAGGLSASVGFSF